MQTLRASPTWRLLKFLLGLGLISGLYALYVWQTSTITLIEHDTHAIRAQIGVEEQENVALMMQVAAWNRPDYVESKAVTLGMVPSPQSAFVQAPASNQRRTTSDQTDALTAWWQDTLIQLSERLNSIIPPQLVDLAGYFGLR
jgi:hypothetical protein